MFKNKKEKNVEQNLPEGNRIILETLKTLTESQVAMNGVLQGILKGLEETTARAGNRAKETEIWLNKFHAMLLNEYAKGPHSQVYAFAYHCVADGKRKQIIVTADTFEKAHEISLVILKDQGFDVTKWTVDMYDSIKISHTDSIKAVNKVSEAMGLQKPIQMYINELMLSRDRFADDKEKVVINKIIKKIQTQYAKSE